MPTPRPLDSFARDNLPPREQWPVFLLDRPEFQYPERLNCAVTLLDDQVEAGHGQKPCILAPGTEWTYADLLAQVNRIANVLVGQFGLAPGNRVLLRAPEQSLDGRHLPGGDQGGRHRRRDHAAAAGTRTRHDHREGADHAWRSAMRASPRNWTRRPRANPC